jgi:alanyl-tRNA synthetase
VDALKEILDEEELSFAKTLDRGEMLFEKYLEGTEGKIMSGADVWRLYDTFGFPIDLTRLMAEERGFTLDEAGVLEEETKAKELSRGARKGTVIGEVVAFDVHAIGEIEEQKVPRTDDSFKYGLSKNFDKIGTGNVVSSVKALYQKGFKDECHEGNFGIVLDKSNFYAEQGGQEYV